MDQKDIYQQTLDKIEEAWVNIQATRGQPVFVPDPVHPRFEFAVKDDIQAVLLKLARMISGLEAMQCLLERGLVQEIGALCRMQDEFFEDIFFLLEGYPEKELTEHQKQYLKDFYQKEFANPADPYSIQKRHTVPKKKVHAAMGRLHQGIMDPEQVQKIHSALSQAFSGYIHGAYGHIMEMYGGGPPKMHLRGMQGTPRIEEWRAQVKTYFFRTIIAFMGVAYAVRLNEQAESLHELKDWFEKEADMDFPPLPPVK